MLTPNVLLVIFAMRLIGLYLFTAVSESERNLESFTDSLEIISVFTLAELLLELRLRMLFEPESQPTMPSAAVQAIISLYVFIIFITITTRL